MAFCFQCNEEKTFKTGGSRNYHSSGGNIHHGSIQYVQPVRVVPHGSPIPAIPVKGSYSPPRPSYSAPKPSYNAPSSSYGAPPASSYGAPSKPTYNAGNPNSLTQGYSAPKPDYTKVSYSAVPNNNNNNISPITTG